MLKICLFFAIFEPRVAYKGDAYIKKRDNNVVATL